MSILKGYKVTDSNIQCRGFQFELGVKYTASGAISICNNGFHFCELPQHCFNYYDFTPTNRVFEIEGEGESETNGDKTCVRSITLIRELSWEEVLKIVNTGTGNSGHSNSGYRNSGDRNSGNRNSGDYNSGYRNSGDRNSGDYNSGDSNSGDRNSGNSNSGYRNSGDRNSGDSNSGNYNSGNYNSGNYNSGNWNSGNRNSGDSNSGYRNSGAFCTDTNPKVWLFDQPTNISMQEWENSDAINVLNKLENCIWVPDYLMTDEEKEKHPSHKTTECYLKTISLKESWANLWPNLDQESKNIILSLPNFDADKFEQITGVKIETNV